MDYSIPSLILYINLHDFAISEQANDWKLFLSCKERISAKLFRQGAEIRASRHDLRFDRASRVYQTQGDPPAAAVNEAIVTLTSSGNSDLGEASIAIGRGFRCSGHPAGIPFMCQVSRN